MQSFYLRVFHDLLETRWLSLSLSRLAYFLGNRLLCRSQYYLYSLPLVSPLVRICAKQCCSTLFFAGLVAWPPLDCLEQYTQILGTAGKD